MWWHDSPYGNSAEPRLSSITPLRNLEIAATADEDSKPAVQIGFVRSPDSAGESDAPGSDYWLP